MPTDYGVFASQANCCTPNVGAFATGCGQVPKSCWVPLSYDTRTCHIDNSQCTAASGVWPSEAACCTPQSGAFPFGQPRSILVPAPHAANDARLMEG